MAATDKPGVDTSSTLRSTERKFMAAAISGGLLFWFLDSGYHYLHPASSSLTPGYGTESLSFLKFLVGYPSYHHLLVRIAFLALCLAIAVIGIGYIRRIAAINEELTENEERVRLSLKAANLGFFDVNPLTRETYLSPRWMTMLGYKPDELPQSYDTWAELLHPDDRDITMKLAADRLTDGEPLAMEFRLRAKDGSYRWIFSQGRCLGRDERGRPIRMLGTHTDITLRKHAEGELRKSEARLREAQKIARLGYWHCFLPEFSFEYTTDFLQIVGIDHAANTPFLFPDSLVPEDREDFLQRIRTAAATSKDFVCEARLYDPNDNIRHLRLRAQPVKDPDGRVVEFSGIMQDITEIKNEEEQHRQLELQIQHAQKLESLGVLAGGIAHDFNNILMGILGNADLALQDLSSLSPVRQNIEDIEIAARRAADLCRQMLAYSGKGRFEIRPLDLNKLVEEMTHMMEVSISKKVVLKYHFADNPPLVEGDTTQLHQILMNLVTNASEAIGEKSGVISIRTGAMDCDQAYLSGVYVRENLPDGLYAYIEVSDTGCGMDQETQARIFEPFFTTKFTGRGLGMAAVLGIVRGHKGAIKIYSEVGRGSTFKILFPACTQLQSGEKILDEHEKPTIADHQARVLLLVDDDETVRAIGRRMLERLGFTVYTANNGREGLELYREKLTAIQGVILDLMMPHMDGEETYRELRRINPDVRVILSSGYNEQEVSQRFAGKGIAGFVQKPYQTATLSQKLKDAGFG